MNNTTGTHDHYRSTDVDPTCELCALAVAFRPMVEVLDPQPALCGGCLARLDLDVDGAGEPNVDGFHGGCYVPAARPAGATDDYLVASPTVRTVR
jgi:hypothetical protein